MHKELRNSDENEFPAREIECWSGVLKTIVKVSDDLSRMGEIGDDGELLSVIALLNFHTDHPNRELAIELNNEGVRDLGRSKFQSSIRKLQAAVKADSTYHRARSNLAVAYNNLGLSLNKEHPREALVEFHNALFLDPSNETIQANVKGILWITGNDPDSFEDLVVLGDDARRRNDIAGSIIEYKAALEIKSDANVRRKLREVMNQASVR